MRNFGNSNASGRRTYAELCYYAIKPYELKNWALSLNKTQFLNFDGTPFSIKCETFINVNILYKIWGLIRIKIRNMGSREDQKLTYAQFCGAGPS